jgi:cytochrome c oxidase subunit 2
VQVRRDRRLVLKKELCPAAYALLLLLSGCAVRALDPAGPAAAAIARLWWVMLALAGIVFAAVMGMLGVALWRRRGSLPPRDRLGRWLVAIGGALGPALIILVLMVYNTSVTVELEEPPAPLERTVEVTSHQWWWHVHYPQAGVTTANEVHLPAGTPVAVRLRSADTIHAFWVPELQGKRDMMPDYVGRTWLQADRPGIYRGLCAEFCGLQHAKMQFLVIVHEPEAFEDWMKQRQTPRADLVDEQAIRGQQVFAESGCAGCHAVRGTSATGTLGPDLTHLASRRELGAGTLPNTRENLAAWILNAQQFKPGNRMPPMPVPDQELEDLLAYLETLR